MWGKAIGYYQKEEGIGKEMGDLNTLEHADENLDTVTHDEPWKVLLIKIALAAILLPLHHWSEHKVIHYLSSRKRFKGELRVKTEAVASN